VAEGEILSSLEADVSWVDDVRPVLDTYLRKVGMVSADLRSRWVARILSGLQAHMGNIAPDDILEQAIERLRESLNAKLALVANLDPLRDGREIAGMLVVLQDEKYADLVNALFGDWDAELAPMVRERLRRAVAADCPRPVPSDAPLEFPTQVIQLRTMNPLRWLFRRGR
jgi:hypothetical protein